MKTRRIRVVNLLEAIRLGTSDPAVQTQVGLISQPLVSQLSYTDANTDSWEGTQHLSTKVWAEWVQIYVAHPRSFREVYLRQMKSITLYKIHSKSNF